MRDATLLQAKILIIDDEADVVEFFQRILERDGYADVQGTTDPFDAVRLFGEFQPDLVVLDLIMPGRSGFEVLADILAIIPPETHLPILVITGDLKIETRREVLSLGATDFVTKPFDIIEILARIENLLKILLLGRRKAEAAGLESEESFFGAFEHAPIGVALVSPDGRWLKVNRALCDLVGYSEAELLARTFQDISHPEDLAADLENQRRMIAGEAHAYQAEKRYLHARGHIVTALLNVSLIRDRQGQPRHFITQIQDITARKQAEAAHDRLAAILESTTDLVSISDPNGRLVYLNRAGRHLLGVDLQEDIAAANFADFIPNPASHPAFADGIHIAIREGNWTGESVLLSRRGQEIPVSQVIHAHNAPDGKLEFLSTIMHDITARKRAEDELFLSRETLRGVLDHIPQRVFWKDCDLIYRGCNRAFALDMGFSGPDEVIGKTDFDGSWKAVAELYRTDDRTVLDLNAAKCSFEEPGIAADGRPLWLRTSKSPLHDRDGRVTGVLGTYEDITEHKLDKLEVQSLNAELEQRVEQRTDELFAATQKAEQANRAKSEFLSRTSHELRTPLSAILGFGQLLETEKNLGHETRESIAQLLHAARRLLGLVDEVLDISDADSGRITLATEPVPVDRLVDEALSLARPLGVALQVELDLRSPLDRRWRVLANPHRLKQALFTLLSNAIKYNRPRGNVLVECAPAEAAYPPMFRFSVKDTGPGISAGNLTRLFTPFDRLDAERSRIHIVGTGLGLALSKRMVELMGGRIGVESALGEGSTFWIEVPLAEGPGAPLAENAHSLVLIPQSETPRSRTLLYIEGGVSNLRLIKRIVARRPAIRLLSAGTIALGLAMAGEHRPALILLDLHLPGTDGGQVLAQFRANPRTCEIPVIMFGADDPPGQREQMLTAGARAFLTKPVEVRALLGVLDQFVAFQPE